MKFRKRSTTPVVFALLFLLAVLVSGGICSSAAAAADSSPTPDASARARYPGVDFRWAFTAMSIQKGKRITRLVTQDMVLKSGDQLKMMVELQRPCFVYLFHDDPRSGVKLLFPYTLRQFDGYYKPERRYYVPQGDAWFRLDNDPGRETFYLLASARRLDGLEKAYLRYEAADGALKVEAAGALLDRIKELGKKRRELCSPAERPVTIGGAVRSVEDVHDANRLDIATFADEIVSTGFVARTYTIEHK